MLPVLEGLIARRILLNFRAEPAVAQAAVPPPLEVQRVGRQAIVGVCLIRLERIRPKGLPALAGLSSENMAHRFAIRFPGEQGREDGVFIPRRDTDSGFVGLLGGRLFPGYHHLADFRVRESSDGLAMDVRTDGGVADVRLRARWTARWPGSAVFGDLEEASEFFRRAPCGFSGGRDGRTLEGLRLRTLEWRVEPLAVDDVAAAYYDDAARFPPGSIAFDHALVMRAVPHEWHELRHVPELVGDFHAEASAG
jgi:Uncharacterized conserved protein (COG2071)